MSERDSAGNGAREERAVKIEIQKTDGRTITILAKGDWPSQELYSELEELARSARVFEREAEVAGAGASNEQIARMAEATIELEKCIREFAEFDAQEKFDVVRRLRQSIEAVKDGL